MSIANWPHEIAVALENIKTYLLAPNGTPLHEVLALFRRDMKELEDGVDMFDVVEQKMRKVKARILHCYSATPSRPGRIAVTLRETQSGARCTHSCLLKVNSIARVIFRNIGFSDENHSPT